MNFLNESMGDLSAFHGLSYISFVQIPCVFLSLKPNNSNFHIFKQAEFSKTYFPFAPVHLTAAGMAAVLVILTASMLLKKKLTR